MGDGAVSGSAGGLEFRLLGGLSVSRGGEEVDLSTPKQRAVLAVLLLERDRVVSADRMIELLWGGESDKALASLQAYVSRLRTALEPDRKPRDPAAVLLSRAPGYRLAVAREAVDLYRFEDDVAAGLEHLRRGEPEQAASVLAGALRGWSGPLLPELAAEPFVFAAAQRAAAAQLAAVEALGEARLELGDHAGAIALLEPEADRHPQRERLHELLALALYRGARQSDALRVVARCRRELAEQAGLDPGPNLRRLEADLLAQSPALDWRPPPAQQPATAEATAVAAPPPGAPGADRLVGRDREIASLDAALTAAAGGRGGVAVIVGEPGIGKTRLAEAMVELAERRRFATAWARCPESRAAPPFWAMTHIGDQLRGVGVIDRAGSLDGLVDDDAVQERFGLYRAVIDTVAEVERPMLLVVDDLQWADPDSLRLIENIAADLASTRTLLLATTRPLADDSPDALVDCLAEVARVAGGIQVPVSGLGVDDVARWLSERGSGSVPREVAELVHDRTAGNPLFVKEVTELLAAEGRLDDVEAARSARSIPPGVQFVVRRRVSRLPAASQKLLPVAAVVGPTIDVEALAAAARLDTDGVLQAMAPALDAGLLVDVDGEIGFSHALVADALASEVNAVRRAEIHAAVARTLAGRSGSAFGLEAAAIAHHAQEGILAGTGELAIDAGTAAAELAAARFADEDAAGHWADVAAAVARCRPSDVAAQLAALTAQARALMRADMVAAAKRPILRAVDVAGAAGMIEAMVAAASLVNNTHVWTNEGYGVVDEEIVAMLEHTLDAGDHAHRTRAILLAGLAAELVFGDRERHLDVLAKAEFEARASGDPDTLARVLSVAQAPTRPDLLEQRRRQQLELLELVERHELSPDLDFVAHHHDASYYVEIGDMAGLQSATARVRRALDAVPGARLRAQMYWLEAAIAITTGHYDEASELGLKAHELHRRGRHYDADVLYLAGVAAIALDRGGVEDLIPAIETVGNGAYGRTTAESMAFAVLETGDHHVAAELVAPYGPEAGWADDWTTVFCMTAALHVRTELGDRSAAETIATALRPYADRWATAGTSPINTGPASLALARYAAMVGDEAAEGLFARAVAHSERMSSPAWIARCRVHQGCHWRRTGSAADADAALSTARDLAERHALPYVLRRLDALDA
jgi:DNA-binding SARP family transcriptional activator